MILFQDRRLSQSFSQLDFVPPLSFVPSFTNSLGGVHIYTNVISRQLLRNLRVGPDLSAAPSHLKAHSRFYAQYFSNERKCANERPNGTKTLTLHTRNIALRLLSSRLNCLLTTILSCLEKACRQSVTVASSEHNGSTRFCVCLSRGAFHGQTRGYLF